MTTEPTRPDVDAMRLTVSQIAIADYLEDGILALCDYIDTLEAQLAAERAAGKKELADELHDFLSDGDMDSVVQGIQRVYYGEAS